MNTSQTAQTEALAQSATTRPSPWRRVAFTVPLILVNGGALIGQSMWAYSKLVDSLLTDHHKVAVVLAVLFALALESIGVYLALQAHAAMMADQASGGTRLASYGIAAIIAGLNYTHFHEQSMDWAVALALLSLVSPWLWAVDSKAAHRAQLAARGIVDPRGVKLSSVRKLAAPVRSVKVWKWAAWAGETDPVKAVQGWESSQPVSRSTQTEQLRAHVEVASPSPEPVRELPQSTPVQAIESVPSESTESEEITETVTETVTRTESKIRTRSTRTEARMRVLAERVQSVRAHPDYLSAVESGTELTYDQIGSIISRTGRDVIKPVYLVLYRGQSVESIILGENA